MKNKILTLICCLICFAAVARAHKAKVKIAPQAVHTTMISASAPPEYVSIYSRDGQVAVYPNPASDRLYVRGEGNSYNVQLANMIGTVVLNEDTRNGMVSLSEMLPGMYILRIYSPEGQLLLSSKIIIQK